MLTLNSQLTMQHFGFNGDGTALVKSVVVLSGVEVGPALSLVLMLDVRQASNFSFVVQHPRNVMERQLVLLPSFHLLNRNSDLLQHSMDNNINVLTCLTFFLDHFLRRVLAL